MNKPTSPSVRSRAGFTLIEIMVSSLLMAIIMGMLFSILIGTMNAWEGGTSRLQTNGDARMALDMIGRDLQSMVVRQTQSDQQWLVSEPVDVEGLENTWLTFFAPSIDRDAGQEGDIVAISYRTGFQDPLSTNNLFEVFGLYKQMASTEDTFIEALGQTDIIAGFWEAGGDAAPEPLLRDGFLVPNVVRFEVSWWVDFPAESGLRRLDSEYKVELNNVLVVDDDEYPGAKIESADISMTILTEEGMRLAQSGATDMNELIRRFGRVHSTRVKINY